jgi:hypothetical protein
LTLYFSELDKKRRLGESVGNPTGRMVEDGGANGGEFKSKVPNGVRYTRLDSLNDCARVDAALARLMMHDVKWYACVWLSYELQANGSTRSKTEILNQTNFYQEKFDRYRRKGLGWLEDYLK